MVTYCCCYGCNEKFVRGGNVTFHSFPKDEQRTKIWLQKINREDFVRTRHSKVCSKHFTEECFDREKFGGVWLKKDAVPTIFSKCPPKAIAQKRPAKRSLSGRSQNQNAYLASFQSGNFLFLPRLASSVNGERRYSIWYIALLQPLLPKPEQSGSDNERKRDVTAVVSDMDRVKNDSPTNKTQLGVATEKESRHLHNGEKRDYFCRGTVKQEQGCEYTFVKEEPMEDHGESPASATEEEFEHVIVKEEPIEDHDEYTSLVTEEDSGIVKVKEEFGLDVEELEFEDYSPEEFEHMIVKEEPNEDLDESSSLVTEEEYDHTFVKEEPPEDHDQFTCSETGEVYDRITVKMEQEPEYEENFWETYRELELEYIEVKSKPLEEVEATGARATQEDSLCSGQSTTTDSPNVSGLKVSLTAGSYAPCNWSWMLTDLYKVEGQPCNMYVKCNGADHNLETQTQEKKAAA